ncbi:cephalosporin-C deacetylase [Murinocardiopsis flavida]|uniref:Cephalosporin-C deacetylase n=1 Tax=Murinocardiopsis flavida TaxID=645275 RepID=A0A2P8DFJ3_9ACTN|nr:acetylxylan esterase [Murinocardiopsis flavida]PSK95988.1 cephalosporin-C deacetylase [Murinocardiopsis flavida]
MYVDLAEPELRSYRSAQHDPDDFDSFWASTLAQAREHDIAVTAEQVDTGLSTVDVYDTVFSGYNGQRISAWLVLPAARTGPLPAVVQYQGYGGGRAHPLDHLVWASAGYAHLVMDTRGQASAWGGGVTPDPDGGGPQSPGVMTRGIESRETYYYRRLITDAVRAVEAVRGMESVDPDRVAVVGGSQGGALALSVAGLVGGLRLVSARVPFLCDFPRATVITDDLPYKEIGSYLAVHRHKVAQVHDTLSYFDGVNFARRASAPARFSAALMDPVTPPSTVFGAYNAYAGPKEMAVWPYNGHEGGGVESTAADLVALRGAFG